MLLQFNRETEHQIQGSSKRYSLRLQLSLVEIAREEHGNIQCVPVGTVGSTLLIEKRPLEWSKRMNSGRMLITEGSFTLQWSQRSKKSYFNI
jgi:hypothetical protein